MRLSALAIVATLAVATCSPAFAAPCGNATEIKNRLSAKYKEAPVSFGLQTNGNLLQVYASAAGSWTIVSTTPAGMSCVVAAGQGWQRLPDASGELA